MTDRQSADAAPGRGARRRARRDAILDAAGRVFVERGAASATMDEVAEVAGVGKGTLYLYFASKDDLFLALTHRPLDAVLARFERVRAEEHPDGLSLLRALMVAHGEVLEAHAAQFRVVIASLCGGFTPDPAAPSFGSYVARVRTLRRSYLEAIERGIADGSLRDDLDPKAIAGGLWAGMFGATFLRTNAGRLAAAQLPEGERIDVSRLVPVTRELLLDALVPRAARAGATG